MIRHIVFDLGNVLVRWNTHSFDWEPIAETVSLLKEISLHYPVYALTDASPSQIARERLLFPFYECFTDITTGSECGFAKPCPEIYHHFLLKNGLVASECLFMDDRKENVQGAIQAGMAAFLFVNAEESRKHLVRLGIV